MEIIVKSKGKFALHAPDCTLHMESYTDEENFKPKQLENDVGAGCDFFTDVPFIEEVIDRFPLEDGEKLNWLDLGCAGGSLILDADKNEKTDICIGLDGSVGVYKQESWYSGKNKKVLKNADISKDLSIEYEDGNLVKFDVITCWEVIEHFYENELDTFFTNVHKHMADEGVFIGSIAFFPDTRDENGYCPHDPQFNSKGKIFELHKVIWPQTKWDNFLTKWFVIHPFDFENKFRDMDERLTYYFMATKKS